MEDENEKKESTREYFRNYMRAYRAKIRSETERKRHFLDNGYLLDYKKKLQGVLQAYSLPKAITAELIQYINENLGNDKVLAVKANQLLYELDTIGRKIMNEIEVLEVINHYYRKKSSELLTEKKPKE